MKLLSVHLESQGLLGHAHAVIYIETTISDPVEAVNSFIASWAKDAGKVGIESIQTLTKSQSYLLRFLVENGLLNFPLGDPSRIQDWHDGSMTLDKG